MIGGLLLALVFVSGGCTSQPYVTPDRLNRGLVVVLTGIEGRSVLNESIADGLDAGGVSWAIEIKDWTNRWGMFMSLRDEERNREMAAEIAERIYRYQLAYPERPVMLVGHSGGGGMAIYTAEKLVGSNIQGVLLLNAAISKDYRLMRALRRSDCGIVNYYSPLDMVVRLGTLVAGTMDSRYSESAGSVGFEVPTTLPPEYDSLYQIGWSQEMIESFYIGNHLTSSSADYIEKYVAPLVMASEWDQAYVDQVKAGKGQAALRSARWYHETVAENSAPKPPPTKAHSGGGLLGSLFPEE